LTKDFKYSLKFVYKYILYMHVLSYCAVLNLDFMFIHKIKKKISYEYTCIQNFHVFSFCNKNKSYFYCKKNIVFTFIGTCMPWSFNLIYKYNHFMTFEIKSMTRFDLVSFKWFIVFIAIFNNISVILWRAVGGGNRSTRRKPLTCRKSLTNFIT
jgi:hypothetical protein